MTLETSPEYRCRGYAYKNAVTLASFLSDRDIPFYYLVRDENIKSLKIAKKLGLVLTNVN